MAFLFAGLLALLSLAGLVHAFKTPADKTFAAAPQPAHAAMVGPYFAGV